MNTSKPAIYQDLTAAPMLQSIRAGAVGILPTDTVYGLVGRAIDEKAVTRLYALKDRHAKPGTVIAADIDQLVGLGIHRRYLTAVADFWPNPLSIVIPVGEDLDYLTQGKRSLAVRIPADPQIHALLEQTGPLVTSSANRPHEPTVTSCDQAQATFGDAVDFYVDIGDIGERPASTVIRLVDDAIEILRPGAVNINENGEITP